MKNIELLAPAGDQDALIAAVQNGANAIYLGGTLFNARAFAKNFDNEQLKWAVEYAHLRNVKIYVTLNTLYKDEEISDLIEYLDYLYEIQVDALIVQDIGLFDIIRTRYQDFDIHMSTQATIMNQYAANYFQKRGASRVVLARENTLEEIRQICSSTDLEVEVFVHGALCVCYSGQCLMSSFIGKRSGNRGACAQPCRLQYQLLKDHQLLEKKTPFLLSPKDLMTIESIGDLIDTGITSFKIEGRMKRPEYVASAVKAYRKAIDNHINKNKQSLQEDIQRMKAMFNRNYTKGYAFHDLSFVDGDYSGNKGVVIGKVIGYHHQNKHVIIELSETLRQGDSLVFEDIDKGRPVNKIFLSNKLVSQADKNCIVEIEFDYPVYTEYVRKTIDKVLIERLQQTYDKEYLKLPLTMKFLAQKGKQAQLNISYNNIFINETSSITVEEAIKTPLERQRIQQQLSKLGQTSFYAHNIDIQIDDDITLPIKIINEMRRNAINQLTDKLSHQRIHNKEPQPIVNLSEQKLQDSKKLYVLISQLDQLKVIIKYSNIDMIFYPYQSDTEDAFNLCQAHDQRMALFIPRICKDEDFHEIKKLSIYKDIEYIVVNEYGAYNYFNDKQRIIGTGLNVYNSYALAHYQIPTILSLEMSKRQIQQLKGNQQQTILQIYGKIENMISEYCPISQYYFGYQKKNCQLCKQSEFSLIDRKNEKFDLMMDEKCRMHLLNCHTLYIEPSRNIRVSGFFIHFTNEDFETTKEVMNIILEDMTMQKKIPLNDKIKTTYGYFKE